MGHASRLLTVNFPSSFQGFPCQTAMKCESAEISPYPREDHEQRFSQAIFLYFPEAKRGGC